MELEKIYQPWQNEAGQRRVGRQVIHIVQEQKWRYTEARPDDTSEFEDEKDIDINSFPLQYDENGNEIPVIFRQAVTES
jgi:hypothetical protein